MPAVEMEGNQEIVNGWKNVKIIGKGTFGFVELWINEETNEELALKRIQDGQECKQKIVNMWEKEIEIMKKLNHTNVICVRDTPSELKYLERMFPILAMEYCSLGNLRKALNQSYCGFSEADVLHFTNDIAAAVAYLHTEHIVHRDLKPENIVLQKLDNKAIYKLIDLGYAKDLNEGSICKSFVGTLIYLAPEVYRKEQYTHTADYWSLGTVIFEVITGYRPFLPTYSPVKWYEEVFKKNDDHISVQYKSGNIHFSSELPKCIKLCSPLKQSFENWLKIMLKWNANDRGNDSNDKSSKEWCFQQLEKILEAKILRIYHVTKNNLLCYMLEPDQTIEAIQNIISVEAEVPLVEQIIIMRDGRNIDRKQLAEDFLSNNAEEVSLFLLDKRNLNGKPDCNIHLKAEQTQIIMGDVNNRLDNYEPKPKRVFAEVVYFCEKLEEKSRYLIQSIAARRKALALDRKLFLQNHKHPCDIRPQISTKAEFLAKSLRLNEMKWKNLKSKPPEIFNDVMNSWKEMNSELDEIKSFVQEIEKKDYSVFEKTDHSVLMDEFVSNNINTTAFNERFEALKSTIESLRQFYATFDFSEIDIDTIQEKGKAVQASCITEWEALFEECHAYCMSLNTSWITFLETTRQLQEKGDRIDFLHEENISRIWKLIEQFGPGDELSMRSPMQEYLPSFSSANQQSIKLMSDNKLLQAEFDELVSDFPELSYD